MRGQALLARDATESQQVAAEGVALEDVAHPVAQEDLGDLALAGQVADAPDGAQHVAVSLSRDPPIPARAYFVAEVKLKLSSRIAGTLYAATKS